MDPDPPPGGFSYRRQLEPPVWAQPDFSCSRHVTRVVFAGSPAPHRWGPFFPAGPGEPARGEELRSGEGEPRLRGLLGKATSLSRTTSPVVTRRRPAPARPFPAFMQSPERRSSPGRGRAGAAGLGDSAARRRPRGSLEPGAPGFSLSASASSSVEARSFQRHHEGS